MGLLLGILQNKSENPETEMDDLTTDQFLALLEGYTVRDILLQLVEAMTEYGPEEEDPEAWERGAKALEKLAASKDFEDMISW